MRDLRDVRASDTLEDLDVEGLLYDPDFVTPERCSALFLRVLREGVNCALGDGYKVSASVQADAMAWLDSPSFREVCEYAGVDPAKARAAVERLRQGGESIRIGGTL